MKKCRISFEDNLLGSMCYITDISKIQHIKTRLSVSSDEDLNGLLKRHDIYFVVLSDRKCLFFEEKSNILVYYDFDLAGERGFRYRTVSEGSFKILINKVFIGNERLINVSNV